MSARRGGCHASLWTTAQAAAADAHTIDSIGIPSVVLMERAALAVANEIVERLAGQAMPVLVAAGPGNNGADGLAVARLLAMRGFVVDAVLATPKRNQAAQQQLALAHACGVNVYEGWDGWIARAPRLVIVDALLGTGARGTPSEHVALALDRLQALHGLCVAVDTPTGVSADTGTVSGPAFRADVTVTFARSKPGLHVTPGRDHAGMVVIADIGVVESPSFAPAAADGSIALIDPEEIRESLSALPQARHKGERGHVGIVGGGPGTPGAAVLAGIAALRAGAGLVTLVCSDAQVRAQLIAHRPELMIDAIDAPCLAARANVLVVGPGLTDASPGIDPHTLWLEDRRAAVFDASALDRIIPGATPAAARIVTPHPAEAARMLARHDPKVTWTTQRVQAERLDAARTLATRLHAIVVLKGEGTIVVDPAHACTAIAVGGDATLATAGTGDVLAGLMGALLARGLSPWSAAIVATHVHGLAGELAGRRPGALALDIAETLPDALQACIAGTLPRRWPRRRAA